MNLLIAATIFLSQSAPASQIELRTIDGRTIEARLDRCTLEKSVDLRREDGRPERLRPDDIDTITWRDAKEMNATGPWIVQSWDEDSIRGTIADGNEEHLVVAHSTLGPIKLDLDRIKSISRAGDSAPSFTQLKEDFVILKTGEKLTGVIVAMTKDSLSLSQGDDTRTLAWNAVRSLHTATPQDSRTDLRLLIYIADGGAPGRLLARSFKYDSGGGHVTLASGHEFTMAQGAIKKIEILGTRRVWLSQLEPATFKGKPWLSAPVTRQSDRNILGGPLTINCHSFDRGLGLQPASRCTWNLAANFDRLTMKCGIDDCAGPWADADLTITVDGRPAAGPLKLRFGEPLQSIDLKLTGARELTIEVGFGKNGDTQDFIDLVDAALIRRQ